MKLILTILVFATVLHGLQATTYDTENFEGKSSNKLCADLSVDGAVGEAAKAAKEQDIVGNLAKTRESVSPSLDDTWTKKEIKAKDIERYLLTLAVYFGIPAVGFILTILIYPICCSCHLCANCCGYNKLCCKVCCCPPKSDDTYSGKEQLKSCVFFFFFALGTLVCVIIGITGGTTFASGVLELTCKFDGMRATGQGLFDMLLQPADDLVGKIDGIVEATNLSMAVAHQNRGFKYTRERLDMFTNKINQLKTKADDIKNTAPPSDQNGLCIVPCQSQTDALYYCELCYNTKAVSDLSTSLEDNLAEPATKIKKDTEGILEHLINAQTLVKDGVGGVKTSLSGVTSFMGDDGEWHNLASTGIKYGDMAKKYATYATALPYGLVIFGIVLSCIGFVLMKLSQGKGGKNHPMSLGICGKLGSCFVGCGWNLTCITMLIFFLVCTILWPIMWISVDTCVILQNKLPKNVGLYMGLETGQAKMVQSCFTKGGNTSFIPDDLLSNFDFSSAVTFDSTKLNDKVNSLFDELEMQPLRNAVANMTNFTQAQIDGESNAKVKARMKNIKEMKDIMADINVAEVNFKTAMTISIGNIIEIQNITKPLFDFSDGITTDFSCLAVGAEFQATTDILCESIVPGMSLFVIAMLLTAFIGCPMACALVQINKKMGGHGLPEKWELYNNGEVELTGFPMNNKGGYV